MVGDVVYKNQVFLSSPWAFPHVNFLAVAGLFIHGEGLRKGEVERERERFQEKRRERAMDFIEARE